MCQSQCAEKKGLIVGDKKEKNLNLKVFRKCLEELLIFDIFKMVVSDL